MTLSIAWEAFDSLSPSNLHSVLNLRQRVFVVEQKCADLDADEFDRLSFHGIGRDETGDVVAVARILPPHTKQQEASIGRIAVAEHVRRFGYGRALVAAAVREVRRRYPNSVVHIDAQRYLEQFYSSLGFVRFGEPFYEDGIPHIPMKLSDQSRPGIV